MYARPPSRPSRSTLWVGTAHTYGLIPANPREPSAVRYREASPPLSPKAYRVGAAHSAMGLLS
ncbi:MAG: hypothetical protein KKC71_06105 [Chloroflexi bacterium]|nr:hypothetical protein [Chloroflexota bacterium]